GVAAGPGLVAGTRNGRVAAIPGTAPFEAGRRRIADRAAFLLAAEILVHDGEMARTLVAGEPRGAIEREILDARPRRFRVGVVDHPPRAGAFVDTLDRVAELARQRAVAGRPRRRACGDGQRRNPRQRRRGAPP